MSDHGVGSDVWSLQQNLNRRDSHIKQLERELAEAHESAEKAHALYNDCADKLIACEESKDKLKWERDQWREVAEEMAPYYEKWATKPEVIMEQFRKLKEASK